jgi:hypothetical protein
VVDRRRERLVGAGSCRSVPGVADRRIEAGATGPPRAVGEGMAARGGMPEHRGSWQHGGRTGSGRANSA